MEFDPGNSLHWLTASILLLISYGLMWLGIAMSRLTRDEKGQFEITIRAASPLLYFSKGAKSGVKYQTRRVHQATIEKMLRTISWLIGALFLCSVFSFLFVALS